MDPHQIALILVDIQRDFWQPLKEHQQLATFANNVDSLISEARAKGASIVHVHSLFKPDRSDWMLFYRPQGRGLVPCISGTEGALFENFAAPTLNEVIIHKQTFDGFLGTDLEQVLRDQDVKTVLIAGIETSVCVLFTATSAYLRRIVPLVVSDACADEPSRHNSTLNMYGDLCFKTVKTSQIKRDWMSVLSLAEQFVDKLSGH
jgi:nicotinamidase-related amidase